MSYIALATTTLGSAAGSVTFSSIPTSVNGVALRDLVLVSNLSCTGLVNVLYRINNDSGNNYNDVRIYTFDGGTGSSSLSNVAQSETGLLSTGQGMIITQFMDFSATDKHKSVLSRNSGQGNYNFTQANRWASTSAITSIRFYPSGGNFNTGSTFSLYGVA